MKDDDGTEIKLKVLKHPIPVEDLPCKFEEFKDENEDAAMKAKEKDIRCKTKTKQRDYINTKIINDSLNKCSKQTIPGGKDKFRRRVIKRLVTRKTSKELKLCPVKFLKEPLSLEEGMKLSEAKPMTYHVETVDGTYVQKTKKLSSSVIEMWKQNALTLFEFSHVYPFVHTSNKYKCLICAESFLEAKDLREHQTDHTIVQYKQELGNRIRDKNLKVDVSCLQCNICSETLLDLQCLKTHLKDHGKDIDPDFQDNLIPFDLSKDTFVCQICRESFHKLRLLTIHMSKHFSNFHCEQCGSAFISLSLLKRHLQIHKNGSFPCEKCDKVFSNSAKRSIHMKGVHLKQFPRTCPICPERFNSNYRRMKHLRLVHNKISGCHKCETCGREYDLKYQLLVHIRSVHLQERNEECNICHARFFSKYCLSRHMVIHTGEKNFKCEICGKAYARKKSLREHFKSHDGETSFLNGDILSSPGLPATRHPRAHTGVWELTKGERENAATFLEFTTVRPFIYKQASIKCFYCDELFRETQSALKHTDLHTLPERSRLLKQYLKKKTHIIKVDVSELKCKICDKRYSDLNNIKEHLTSAHKKEFYSAGNGLMAYDLSMTKGKFSCQECLKTFHTFFMLNRHMNVHSSVVCETCGEGFMTYQRLMNHKRVHQDGAYKCNKCDVVFTTQGKLRYHLKKAHQITNAKKVKPLRCPHCAERFIEFYEKMTHLKEAHGIKFSFECPECKAEFPTRKAQREHTNKHHSQKMQCKVCGKRFATNWLLRKHMRGHTDEKCDDISLRRSPQCSSQDSL